MKKLFYLIVFLSTVFASAQGLEPKTYVGNGIVVGPKTTTEINALTVTPNGYVQVNETTGTIFLRVGGSWVNTGLASNISITDSGDNFTATDVEGALAELASASGTDSGQTKVYEAGATKTITLSDFLDGGSLTGRSKVIYHTANDTLTLATGLGQTGRLVSAYHRVMGDSVTVLKDAATLVNSNITKDNTGITSDGLVSYTDFFLDILPTGEFLMSNDTTLVAYTAPPAYVYQGDNAADPNNEQNNTTGFSVGQNGALAVNATNPQNGTYSVGFDVTTGGIAADSNFICSGVTSGQDVTITFYLWRPTGSTGNLFPRLNTGDGWTNITTGSQLVGVAGNNTWTLVTLRGEATTNNPSVNWIDGNPSDHIYKVDNIVLTIN